MPTTYEQQAKTKLIATCLAILVIAGVVVLADHLNSKPAISGATTTPAQTAPPDPGSSSSTSNSGQYKDGTYTASTEYSVPPGNEDITVTLTLKNGVVTNSSVENSENDHNSARFQQDFTASYKSYVVGKKINAVHLSYVAGASDTAQAFNDAVSQIASKAQV